MKSYILKRREATFTDAELVKIYADNLFDIDGIPSEELERFSDKERALEVLRGFHSQALILEGCRNKISKSEGSTSFVEYVIEECEVDENGEFISGSDYYTTPNWCDEYGFYYTANEGEDSATFNHSKMWYAMTESNEGWEDLGNGYYDLATALRVAGDSDHYKMVLEIRIPVLCGEECDWLCTDDFRAGEDFYRVEQVMEELVDEDNIPSFEEYNNEHFVRYYFYGYSLDVNVHEYDAYLSYDWAHFPSWWDDPDTDGSAIYEIESPDNRLFTAICTTFAEQINTALGEGSGEHEFDF